MNAAKRAATFAGLVVIVFAIWFAHLWLVSERAVKFLAVMEKLNSNKPPLTTEQVVQLLGQPLRIEHSETTGLAGDVYHYATNPSGGDLQVIFINGVVLHTALPVYTPSS